ALQGKHNAYNSMAAGVAAQILEIRKETIRESLQDFKSLEHRLEFVASVNDIDFINDSKATNVNSVWYALESMNKPVIWIAGGIDKGNDYSLMQDIVRNKVKAIVCLGKDNRKIHEAFNRTVDMIVNTESMKDAVNAARHFATPGDVVLLSPGCASFDLFEDFEDRGRQFKQEVKSL
ncbi:MAG: Mur ligase family protein, partial [Bacteroidota bacterium]